MKERNTSAMLEQGMSGGSCTCGELRKAARAITLLYDNAFKWAAVHATCRTRCHLQQWLNKNFRSC